MFHILCIDHLVLRVASQPVMQASCCGVLGCTVEREEPDLGLTQLRAGSSLIDLVTVDGPLEEKGGCAPAVLTRPLIASLQEAVG